MRGIFAPLAFSLVLASGCWSGSQPPASPPEPLAESAPAAVVPPWVPALTQAQKALLAPSTRPIQTPATRVFPDLGRFGYAPARPLRSPEDALKFAKMVTQVLNDSPRFYSLGEAPPEVANVVAQYGPEAGAPDGFSIVRRRDGGVAELASAPGAEEARAAIARGQQLLKAGDLTGAIFAYREGIAKSAGAPALRTSLAAALRAAGRATEAEAVLREALAIDPTFAVTHLGLAEMAEQRGDLAAARASVIEALALHPGFPPAMALASKIGSGERNGGWLDAGGPSAKGAARVTPPRVFLDVDEKGAIHVATAKTDAAQIYGGCRAIMRYEPDVREQLWRQPKETPYYLSMGEEVVCLEAAIGAYLAGRGSGDPPSKEMEALAEMARTEGLSGYVMFEILGQHRPERARTAPADVHRDVVAYIEKHVMSAGKKRDPAPDQPYTAAR